MYARINISSGIVLGDNWHRCGQHLRLEQFVGAVKARAGEGRAHWHGELMDDIYWETDNPDKRSSKGRIFFEEP